MNRVSIDDCIAMCYNHIRRNKVLSIDIKDGKIKDGIRILSEKKIWFKIEQSVENRKIDITGGFVELIKDYYNKTN